MADPNKFISQVKLPSGEIYEIKDKWAREQISGGVSFVVCSDKNNTPIGVTWANEQGQIVQGELKASEALRGTFYLVPAYGDGYTVDSSDSTGDQSHFDEYVSAQVGSTFMWERLGRKDIDLTNYLRVDDAAATYLKKSTDTATGVHTYSYNGEALKVTGTSGQVTVSGNSGKIAVTGTSGSISVSGSSGSVVVGSSDAKTTVNKSSVKVQANATQNVTVGTTKVTITGCSSVTSEWNKDELKFTPATAGQTMEVKSDGTIVKKTGTNGATTNTYSFKGDFSSNNNAVVRKSDLANWDGSNKYVKKAGDTMTGSLTVSADATSNNKVRVGSDDDEYLDVKRDGLTIVNNCGTSTPVELTTSSLTIEDSCGATTLNGANTASIVHSCGSTTHTYSFKGDFSSNDNAVVRKSDLANWDGSNKYVKKAGDTMSGALTNTYAGDAIVLTGTGGAVKVAPISVSTYANLGDSTLRMGNSSSGADNDKAELTKDSLQIYLGDANKYTKVEGDKVTVQTSDSAKTTVGTSSVKVQSDGTQNVTVGTGSVVVTGCSGVTATLDKNALAFTVDDCGGASLTVCGSGTAQFGTCGVYTFADATAGTSLDSLSNTDIIRKSDLLNYVGSQEGPYLKKDADDTTSGKYEFTVSNADAIKLSGANGGINVKGSSGKIVVGPASTNNEKSVQLTKSSLTFQGGTNNTATLKIEAGGTVTRSTNGVYTFSACATGTAISNLTDTDIIRKKDLTTYISSDDTYVEKAGDTMSGNLTFTDSGEGVVLRGGSGNASYRGALTAAYSSGKLTTKIVSTGCGASYPATTYEFPTNSGGDTTFAGSGATSTTVMRKGDLEALAFKASVSGTATGSINVYKWKLGTDTTKPVTFSTTTGSTFQHQPEGVVALPAVKLPSSAATVTPLATAASKTVIVAVTMAMDTSNPEQLNLGYTTGASVDTTQTVTAVKGGVEATCTVTGNVDSSGASGTTNLGFTGKKYLVTSVYPGALAHDGTEAISGVSLSVSAS